MTVVLYNVYITMYTLCKLQFRGGKMGMYSNMQIWARDNTFATTWPCFQTSKLLDFTFLLYSLWQPRLNTETLIFFEFFLVPETLLRYRVVVVAKLNKLLRSQLCTTYIVRAHIWFVRYSDMKVGRKWKCTWEAAGFTLSYCKTHPRYWRSFSCGKNKLI